LIVVDNNSDDHTQDVVRFHAESCNFRIDCIKEKIQGIAYARNLGIRSSRGRVIAFTDDDVTVDKLWLQRIMAVFDEHGAVCAGGKILPIWEAPRPEWLKENFSRVLALLDYGDNFRHMREPLLWGANIAVSSDAFRKFGLFSTRLGRVPGKLYGGEEIHFIRKLIEARERVLYTPEAVVYHHIPTERMKKAYFRKWRFDVGEQFGLMPEDNPLKKIGSVPFYIMPRLAFHSSRYLFHVLTLDPQAFEYELNVAELLGMIVGRLKYRLLFKNAT
jgi:glycosyltransferase involved in cell wall biosynthesis